MAIITSFGFKGFDSLACLPNFWSDDMSKLLDTVFKSLGIFVMVVMLASCMVVFKGCESVVEGHKVEHSN